MLPLRPPVTLSIVTEKMSGNKGVAESFTESSILFAESLPNRHYLIGSDQVKACVYSPSSTNQSKPIILS